MNKIVKFLVLILLFNSIVSFGQISPGQLTKAHAKYEGMSNCTLCHDLGNKVASTKCLECHKDIQSLIKNNQGFHVSKEVKTKDCVTCHNEHHGRKFEMIRFDKEKFNHDLTGYKLEGKHAKIDCKKCHKSDFITDKDIKKRPNTFLGLDTKCLSCHDDYHQKTLSSNDCVKCHNTEKFSPAKNFDHNKADFKLLGKHKTVDCKKCHEVIKKNGKDFQKFNNIPFKDCKSCHDNPHNETITGACTQCHTAESFTLFKGRGRFNHNTTNFTLKGKHKTIDCFLCHKKTTDPKLIFQDRLTVKETNCIECHKDSHEGKLGNDCAKCHNEISFTSSKKMKSFDHNLTDFPLEGRHKKVDCKKCHKVGKFTDAIDFSTCNSCHKDYHEGEFKKNNITPDCKTCHSLENGFTASLFNLESHKSTEFPLEGSHAATPCFACHINETNNRWVFNNKGTKCVDCHTDIHKNYITEKYYPKSDCTSCHISEAWTSVSFDHKKTDWPLEGKHLEIDCKDCHFKNAEKGNKFNQKFAKLESDCISCHESKHGDQFAVNGKTDCVRCHVFKSWIPEKFDHNTTAFRLQGKHAEIECSQCHIATINTENISFNYKIKKHQCIDCHQQ